MEAKELQYKRKDKDATYSCLYERKQTSKDKDFVQISNDKFIVSLFPYAGTVDESKKSIPVLSMNILAKGTVTFSSIVVSQIRETGELIFGSHIKDGERALKTREDKGNPGTYHADASIPIADYYSIRDMVSAVAKEIGYIK